MKIIKHYKNQRYFNIKSFLKDKGYTIQKQYHLFNEHVKLEGVWCEIWSLHIGIGEENYVIIRQKEPPYCVYIIDIEEDLITSLSIQHFLETGEPPEPISYLDFVDIESLEV